MPYMERYEEMVKQYLKEHKGKLLKAEIVFNEEQKKILETGIPKLNPPDD